ncbi:winged helix-turn-helix domain-containing protein [Knoellia sp. CPCC 206435]|uniref:winged helix-turn-helix domain-containing protein n=1 Tax=Knoellia terrae TaxID=3404797 RepID=UPI003B4323EC
MGTMTPPHPTTRLSRLAARRIALAAQGFDRARPAPWTSSSRQVQRVIDTVGVIQIDSVNVVSRSHYLPFYSRLGPHDSALVDRARDRAPRRLVEYWAHEASLVPASTWPLLTFRMRRAQHESWGGMQSVQREHPALVEAVLTEVRLRGPMTSRELEAALAHDLPRERDQWGWNWSLVKNALEHLFWAGRVSSAGRTSQFERRYAVPSRVLPPHLHDVAESVEAWPSDEEAFVGLTRIAARAHGVGTEQCLRDYFRLRPEQAAPAIATLVEAGELVPVTIEGWKRPAYLHRDARRPRRIAARALLSPFDSLIWQRDRTSALFGFDYRLEIYVPEEKRVHGYYVLPFLLGEDLVARVDLKADRLGGRLLARRITWEPGRGGVDDARELHEELRLMADWLGLADVETVALSA